MDEPKEKDLRAMNEEKATQEKAKEKTNGPHAQEHEQLYEKYLYLAAEFDNFKRRVAQERTDWIRAGEALIVTDLLGILDEFDRAQEYSTRSEVAEADRTHLEGFWLIAKSIRKLLDKFDVQEVAVDLFDPEFHEAIDMIDTDEYSSGQVVTVVKKGYQHKGRLLRPAQVIVAR